MKLYATVKSERAEKGQGGNEKLQITVTAGSRRETLAVLETEQTHGNVAIYSLYCGDARIGQLIDAECPCEKCRGKGERQKGERAQA